MSRFLFWFCRPARACSPHRRLQENRKRAADYPPAGIRGSRAQFCGTTERKICGFTTERDKKTARMTYTDLDATQRTTTAVGSEHPAQEQQVPDTMNKMNKHQFEQILKRRNYKRGLLKCVDAMARKKVLRCTQLATLIVCD